VYGGNRTVQLDF